MMIASYLGTLSFRVKERFLDDAGGGALAPVLDRDLDLERGAGRRMRGTQVRKRDVPLEQGRPGAAGGIARLLGARVDRHAHAPRRRRQARGEAHLRVQALERVPLDLDAD